MNKPQMRNMDKYPKNVRVGIGRACAFMDVQDGGDATTMLTDALADLMHWAMATDADWDDAMRRARSHHESERVGG